MILDERTEFADAATITTSTGRSAFGDVIDSSVARDLGNGRQLAVIFQITTAVTSGGATTITFEFVSDAAEPPAADGTETLHAASADIAKASLVAGYEIPLMVGPEGSLAFERYLGVQTVVSTTALSTGAANAFLVLDFASWKSYADATN